MCQKEKGDRSRSYSHIAVWYYIPPQVNKNFTQITHTYTMSSLEMDNRVMDTFLPSGLMA